MTPSEKWERLSNPKTLGDYGLSMPLSELAEVPEAVVEFNKYGIDVLDPENSDCLGIE
ncbi:hypothetical protein LCGC14_2452950 [marine sediment metagenome]|uniref:Uncharacterized protein n=1 Tax=marine sediment metagenome TaxID=412755 RepID=A0A0F9BG30_9ZZZZ